MSTTTIIFIIVGSSTILFGLLWRLQIRKSKMQDPDFNRNDAAKKRAEG